MSHIIDKITARRIKYGNQKTKTSLTGDDKDVDESWDRPSGMYYSFEFFPPKTEPGLDNLLTRIERMARRLDPLFIDVTWGSGLSTAARTLAVASHAQRYCGVDVLLHLTTTSMTRSQLESALQQAKSCGIRNILALRGDPPRGKRSWAPGDTNDGYCSRATDLVKLIRELHGDYFGIAVAGHPEGHPSSYSMDDEMGHLKEKIDAGADFIITQFFYDTTAFLDYVERCRQCGIVCPILPGIMPIQSFSAFIKMTTYCGVAVPNYIMEKLEPVKDDDERVKQIGCEIAVDMCRQILTKGNDVDGIHFYTLNLERSVTTILMSMGAIDVVKPLASSRGDGKRPAQEVPTNGTATSMLETVRPNNERQFPWRPSALAQRSKEDVR